MGTNVSTEVSDEGKPWWQSKTIVFIGVSLLAKIGVLFGLEVDTPALTEIVLLVLALAADVGGIWGRDRAERPIRWRRARTAQDDAGAGDPDGPDGAVGLHERSDETVRPHGVRDGDGYWGDARGPFHERN